MVRLWRAKTTIEKVHFLNKHFGLGNQYIKFLRSGKITPLNHKQKQALREGKERLSSEREGAALLKEWHWPGNLGPLERCGTGPWPECLGGFLTEEEFQNWGSLTSEELDQWWDQQLEGWCSSSCSASAVKDCSTP